MAEKSKLGRLKSLGIESEMQVALYLPDDYLDLRKVLTTHAEAVEAAMVGSTITVQGELMFIPEPEYSRGQQPRMQITLRLSDNGKIGFSIFDTDSALKALVEKFKEYPGHPITVNGLPLIFGNSLKLNSAQIVKSKFVGKVLPNYKGKPKVLKPDTVRSQILPRLEKSIPLATDYLKKMLAGADVSSIFDINHLETVLSEAHTPSSMKHAQRANEILNLVAAVISKQKVVTHIRPNDEWNVSARVNIASRWPEVAQMVEFTLTGEQVQVIQEITEALNKAVPMRGMLQGDVGSGKTVSFGIPAISAALEGKNVAIMLPNSSLAFQVYEELCNWIPKGANLNHAFINGDTPEGVGENLPSGKLLVGTSALLFRNIGHIDWMIVDEQQKFSREQREQLMSEGTHLLESSATPIPRSVALVKYGAMQVWRLHSNHTKKEIESYLLTDRQSKYSIIDRVQHTISVGNQAIIVYSLKDDSEAEGMENIVSAEKAFGMWNDRYPGQVRLVHSKMKDEEKNSALQEMKDGKAKLLISTTVVEVGVTIPGVHLLAVVNAERHGLTGLHQLRGRLCRKGNMNGQVGEFLMLTKDNPSKKTINRLNVMLETNDGYEIAEKDVKLRGFGDLHINGETQSGADKSVFIGRKIDIELLEAVV